MTERPDDAMAHACIALQSESHCQSDASRYIACWRQVADPVSRHQQLEVVLALVQSLDILTRKPSLRMLLEMMRRPAVAARLGSLQTVLESGFDAFQTIHGEDEFLKLISLREIDWIQRLFGEDAVACETKLNALLTSNSAI